MSKRSYSSVESVQPIKKQITSKLKARSIRSSSSERTLQLLYEGASKFRADISNLKSEIVCAFCASPLSSRVICTYCDRTICQHCTHLCYVCKKEFCANCSFLTYDQNESVCYNCCT